MKRDASELQTMHHYHRIIVAVWPGCAGVGVQQSAVSAVRAGHQSQTLHDAMMVKLVMSVQTDVMPVSSAGRHSHDVMQTAQNIIRV